MWRRSRNASATNRAGTSFIDDSCEVEGQLRVAGTLVLNGKFRGELAMTGTLLVGEAAEVEAEVRARVVIVNGRVKGNIAADERVELRRTAHVVGDITTPVMVLQEGVIFDGHCRMNAARSAEPGEGR